MSILDLQVLKRTKVNFVFWQAVRKKDCTVVIERIVRVYFRFLRPIKVYSGFMRTVPPDPGEMWRLIMDHGIHFICTVFFLTICKHVF